MAQVDPRHMLNNFCFHVYAQKSLIKVKMTMLFLTSSATAASAPCDIRVHRAGSQLKIWAFELFPIIFNAFTCFMKFVLIVRLNRVKT